MNNRTQQQHTRGAALLLFVIFFLFASVALTYLISKSIYSDLVSQRLLTDSKTSYFVAEASAEDVAYRYIQSGLSADTLETLTIGGAVATTTVTSGSDTFTLNAVGNELGAIRKVQVVLNIGSGASFNFGVQTGNGGFSMTNSSKVIGNVFSNGNVTGQGTSVIEGDVIAAGIGSTVDGVHATGSIHADNILNSTIDMDSFYGTDFINNSYDPGTVHGPGWPLASTTTLPFPDDKVDAHKASVTQAIADGVGTHVLATDPECSGGVWEITDDTTFSEPTRIDCDLTVRKQGGSTVLTLEDTLWVAGDLTFSQGPTIEATPTVSTSSVLVIVDNESDRINSSMIDIRNGTEFVAPSSPKSYIMLVSMNEDAELGGSNTAISMGQSSNGDVIVYAGHGEITLTNQITLKEVTGYLIDMGNNTTIEYESGLINLNFTSGPGGGFEFGGWSETE